MLPRQATRAKRQLQLEAGVRVVEARPEQLAQPRQAVAHRLRMRAACRRPPRCGRGGAARHRAWSRAARARARSRPRAARGRCRPRRGRGGDPPRAAATACGARRAAAAAVLDGAVFGQAQQLAHARSSPASCHVTAGPSAALRPRTASSNSLRRPPAGTRATMNGATWTTSTSGPRRRASRSACSPLPSASTTSAARLRGSRQAAVAAAASMAAGVAGGSWISSAARRWRRRWSAPRRQPTARARSPRSSRPTARRCRRRSPRRARRACEEEACPLARGGQPPPGHAHASR